MRPDELLEDVLADWPDRSPAIDVHLPYLGCAVGSLVGEGASPELVARLASALARTVRASVDTGQAAALNGAVLAVIRDVESKMRPAPPTD